MSNDGYSEYDSIKIKLRVNDDTMKEEIEIYMQDIDDLITNRLRAKLGYNNIYGAPITLPLSQITVPTLPLELKAIANDLVVAKIRLQNSEKPLLWDAQVKILDNYLERVYGWTSNSKYQPLRTLTITPTGGIIGSTVTIDGTNFQPVSDIRFVFANMVPITTPINVVTDSLGVFTGVTFVIPINHADGSYEIKVNDNFGGEIIRFQVTS